MTRQLLISLAGLLFCVTAIFTGVVGEDLQANLADRSGPPTSLPAPRQPGVVYTVNNTNDVGAGSHVIHPRTGSPPRARGPGTITGRPPGPRERRPAPGP